MEETAHCLKLHSEGTGRRPPRSRRRRPQNDQNTKQPAMNQLPGPANAVADLGGGGRGALAGGNGFGPVLKGGPAGGNLLAGRPKILGEGEMKTYIRHCANGKVCRVSNRAAVNSSFYVLVLGVPVVIWTQPSRPRKVTSAFLARRPAPVEAPSAIASAPGVELAASGLICVPSNYCVCGSGNGAVILRVLYCSHATASTPRPLFHLTEDYSSTLNKGWRVVDVSDILAISRKGCSGDGSGQHFPSREKRGSGVEIVMVLDTSEVGDTQSHYQATWNSRSVACEVNNNGGVLYGRSRGCRIRQRHAIVCSRY